MGVIDDELAAASAALNSVIKGREKELSKMHLSALRLARASIEGVTAAIKAGGAAGEALSFKRRQPGDPAF